MPGQFNDPRIKEERMKIAETAKKHGKFAGTVGSTGNLKELTDMGYQLINIGADVVGLQNYCKDLISKANNVRTDKVDIYR